MKTKEQKLLDSFFLEGKITEVHAKQILELICDYTSSIKPLGVSQWQNMGIRCGYDKYFGIVWKTDKEQDEFNATRCATFSELWDFDADKCVKGSECKLTKKSND